MRTGVKLYDSAEATVEVNTQAAAQEEQANLDSTTTQTAATEEKVTVGDVADTFVRGLGTVFLGLLALIVIIKIMGALCVKFVKEAPKAAPAPKSAPAAAKSDAIANRGEFIAAVSAAIATVMGKDVGAIRIVSVKKVD